MKTLLVVANPSKTSFSHAMANAYAKKCEESEILDLYDLNQGYLTYESMGDLKTGKIKGMDKIKQVQDKISSCDEIAFFFPVWWGGVPAILKNFFDSNLTSGFAFKYVSGKSMPEKLLTDKTAKVFATCDAPGFVYKIPFILGINLKKFLKSSTLGFCGIKMTKFLLVDKISKKTSEEKEKILKNL